MTIKTKKNGRKNGKMMKFKNGKMMKFTNLLVMEPDQDTL